MQGSVTSNKHKETTTQKCLSLIRNKNVTRLQEGVSFPQLYYRCTMKQGDTACFLFPINLHNPTLEAGVGLSPIGPVLFTSSLSQRPSGSMCHPQT